MNPDSYIDKNMPSMISELQNLVAQPSVSATGKGIEKCAKLVAASLKRSGIHSEILRLDNVAPLVYGHVISKKNPKKTLLFYNHYDVQPAEPLDKWTYPPFGRTVKGKKVYGRGSSDDKGELVARIKAVESLLKTKGDLPCSIKFVIEGEEETGSAHIEKYLKKYKKKFSCNAVIWEFGFVDSNDLPVVSLGMKGMLFAEFTARGPNMDAHSSLAVLIKNPAWRLLEALQTMRASDGRVLIDDWYKDAKKFTAHDLKLITDEPFDERAFKKEYGIREFVGGRRGTDVKAQLVGGATCNIAGILSGYTGKGAKTILPSMATAKVDFRLVPGMSPTKQRTRLLKHLKSRGFSDIQVKIYHSEAASRTNPDDKFVTTVCNAADSAFGGHILSISSAGTGPMHQFASTLKSPCVSIGCTHIFARIHSPNEYARKDLLNKAAKCMSKIIQNFA
ncbi:MAG: Peptidase M20 [Cenarchaeum symbiont of Oopsacas minuta]|nr:Peptidase M20 [Cenarchaeum symbiont of Oopsacas minuta]